MEFFQLIFPIAIGVAMAYIWSWPLGYLFTKGKGPLLQINRGVAHVSHLEAGFMVAFKVGTFYAPVVAILTIGSAGLVAILNGNPNITRGALLVALFSVAIARFMVMNYSCSMMQSLYALGLGVFAGMGYLVVVNADYAHEIISRAVTNPNLIQLYGIGVITAAFVGESCWFLGGRISSRARQVTYSLFREYHEAHEPYEMAAYRGRMEVLFKETVKLSILEMGLKDLCWKTWSGEPKIAQELIVSVCTHLATCVGGKPYREMTFQEKKEFQENQGKEYIRALEREGKARILMPLNPQFPDAVDRVEQILGIKPKQIPDVGNRRYLVINRRDAIISVPIPAEFSYHRNGIISETGSNFAIVTRDPSRVHDCLIEFNSLWHYDDL